MRAAGLNSAPAGEEGPMEFDRKVVWLTGGGGRIGPFVASAFAREGAAVAILSLIHI